MKKRLVSINGRFLTQQITGVQRYACELIQAMDVQLSQCSTASSKQIQLEILAPRKTDSSISLRNIAIRHVGKLTGHSWEQLELPIYARGNLLFTPCGGPSVMHQSNIFTIHDAAIYARPEAFSKKYTDWYRFLYSLTARRAPKLFTVSHFSKNELVRWLRIPEERITVAYPGHEQILKATASKDLLHKLDLTNKRYVFAVGSMNANKNFSSIIKAMNLLKDLDVVLVITGGVNQNVFGHGLETPKNVVRTGYVSDSELRTLYENALCFVFPSLYEGFGSPPVEAMSCGCPVIVSNCASLPEICGDAGLYCDPHDPSSIAEQIRSLASNCSLRTKMITAGLERSLNFTYAETARTTLGVFTDFLE